VHARNLVRRWKAVRQDVRRSIALRFVSDRDYLRGLYFSKFGRWPDLERPAGFNEKIIVKILSDRRSFMTLFADKLRVRDYVRRTTPDLDLPTLYWWSSRADTLPFDELPNAFVMKANHGSGWLQVGEDRMLLRRKDLVAAGNRWLRRDFSAVGRERAYSGGLPRSTVIALSRPTTFVPRTTSSSAARCAWSKSTAIASPDIPRLSTMSTGDSFRAPLRPRRAGTSTRRIRSPR
jgi:hypothetical protein